MTEGMTDKEGNPIRVLEIRFRYYRKEGEGTTSKRVWLTEELIEQVGIGPHKLIDYVCEKLFDELWPNRDKEISDDFLGITFPL